MRLKVPTEIDSELEGVTALCKIQRFSRRFALECEGIVMGIGEIASPQIDMTALQLHADMSPQQRIDLLLVSIHFIPIDAAESVEVGSEDDGLKIVVMKVNTIVCKQ